jgi:hypothetical protein
LLDNILEFGVIMLPGGQIAEFANTPLDGGVHCYPQSTTMRCKNWNSAVYGIYCIERLTATLALLEKQRRIPRVWRTKLEGQLICKGCIPNSAVSTPRRNPRPDRPPLHVVHTGPKVVSYPWLQRRNRGWFWVMLLGVLFGSLILSFANWLSR